MEKQIKFSTNIFNLNSNINEILNYTDSNILLMYHLYGFLGNTFIEFCDINKTNKNFIRFITKNNFYVYCTTVEEQNYFENLKNWGVNIVNIRLGEDIFFDKKEKTVTEKIEVGHYRINKKWVHKYIIEKRKERFYNIKEQYKEFFMPKFDLIVGNPPYQRSLHLKILLALLDKFEHKLIFIHPGSYAFDAIYNDKLDLGNNIKNIKEIEFISKQKFMNIFAGTCQSQNGAILHLDKNCNKTLNDFRNEYNSLDKKILIELKKYKTLADQFNKEKTAYFVNCPFIHGHQGQKDFYEIVSPKCTVNGNTSGTPIYFNSKEEANNFINVFKLDVYRYIVSIFKHAINVPYDKLPWLEDYKTEWTNELLADKLELNNEELNIIKNEIAFFSNSKDSK